MLEQHCISCDHYTDWTIKAAMLIIGEIIKDSNT